MRPKKCFGKCISFSFYTGKNGRDGQTKKPKENALVTHKLQI